MLIEIYLLIQVALIPVIVEEFQLSLLEASLIATVPNLIMLLMNIPSGFLADHFSPKHLLALSMIIEGISAFFVSQTRNFWTLVLGVSLLKISSPIYHIAGLSLLSRLTTSEKVGRWVGYHNALGNVGTAAGLVTLAVSLSTTGWRLTYMFWTFPVLFWSIILLRFPRFGVEKAIKNNYFKNKSGLKKSMLVLSSNFTILLIAIAVREIGASGSNTYMTTFFTDSKGLSETAASLIFSLGPFVGILGSLGGGFLCEKLGAKKALCWNIFGCAVTLLLLPLTPNIPFLIFIYMLYSLFNSALWSPMNALVAKFTPEAKRGMGYSFYFFTEGLLASAAPTLAALIIEFTDVWFLFQCSAFFMFVSIGILLLLP